jgi:AcrR family transcriptional regulator
MADAVKANESGGGYERTRRTRRDVSAEATERAIVDAAFRLFRERGYRATRMEDLAAAAGVVVQTIYNSIGGKRAVLSRVIDFTAAGPEAPTSVPAFMQERTAAAARPDEIVEMLADWFVDVHARMGNVWEIVAQAAAVDRTVAELELQRARQRFRNYHDAAAALAKLGGLGGLAATEAAAVIWTLGHPLVRRFLVVDEAWPQEQYRAWLVAALGRILDAGGSGDSRLQARRP